MPFHWYGVCGFGTKFDTLAVTSLYRPVTSRLIWPIVSAISMMPSRSASRSPGRPQRK